MPLVRGPVSTTQHRPSIANFPLSEADRCVLCGLCLPHCPTYRVTQDENESPRGRVVLLRAVVTGTLSASKKITRHLSLCLACRACERVCPSGVRYGVLIEAGRAQIQSQSLPMLARIGLRLVTHVRLLEKSGTVVRLYQRSGLQALARLSGILPWLGVWRLESLLPPMPAAQTWQAFYPAQGQKRGRVALFLGCVARLFDAPTLATAIRLLTRLGYEVVVPAEQTCCGALHRDAGDTNTILTLAARNRAAFQQAQTIREKVDAIISVASGCANALTVGNQSVDVCTTSCPPVKDINQFLVDLPLPKNLQLAPLATTVVVQDPCSLRNALRAEQSVYSLLRRIPELQVLALPENHLCCGGAGAYPLRQPGMSERLRDDKMDHLKQLQPSILVTANIGCGLHLAAGVRESDMNLEIIHPLVLFERQLRETTA